MAPCHGIRARTAVWRRGFWILVALGSCAAPAPDEVEDPHLGPARQALAAGDPHRALSLLSTGEVSRSLEARILVQDARLSLGEHAELLRETEAALRRTPANPDDLYLAARLRDDESAALLLEEALRLDPGHARAHLGLASLAARKNELETAEEHLSRALAGDPGLTIAYRRRAEIRERLGDYRGAVADYRKWLRSHPGDADAIYNLANVLHGVLGDADRARPLYRRLLDIDPHDGRALVGLGVLLQESEEHLGAERLYLAAAPREPSAWFNLGLLYLDALDRPREARECLERFLRSDSARSDPTDRVLYAPLLLQEIEDRLGDTTVAQDDAKREDDG